MPDVAKTTNKPNNLSITPSVSDKVTAGGALLFNTAVVSGAPLLNNLNPNINPQNAGGTAVSLIGNGILVIVQGLSAQDWFDDYKYAVWACVGFSVVICCGLYIFMLGNPELGVLNSLGAMYTAATGYGPFKKLGVFSRPGDTTPEQQPVIISEDEEVVNVSNSPSVPVGPSASSNLVVRPRPSDDGNKSSNLFQ